jgi:RimJ/RimL family protein N-acetyltransferase
MSAIPTLTTPRLTLQAPTLNDFADSAAMWGDEVVTRHIGGRPSSGEEVWARLMRYVGHWTTMGFGYWTVRDAAGAFVGEVGFADWRREIDPPFNGAPESGWALATRLHGQGYATEAVSAITAWGDARWPGARTVCMIDPDNAASIRVAEKCGYACYAETLYRDSPTLLFERYQR